MKMEDTNEMNNTNFDSEIVELEEQLSKNIEDIQSDAKHFKHPDLYPFYADERATTTVLFGGLTEAHEELMLAHLQSIGYNVERLPEADFDSLTIGKEFCNKGQCNPTYYTIGNLIKTLTNKAKETSVEEVEKKYVFFTAGSCGPCRFGMYENEYRKALVDAGFKKFRIVVAQQAGGISDENGEIKEPGLNVNKDFFVGVIKAIIVGDLINGYVNKIEPYELIKGSTRKAKAEALKITQHSFRDSKKIYKGLQKVKKIFAEVKCDYTQIKPIVKITGEFWASITESQGNYHIKNWLVSENTELKMEPMVGWLEHLLFSREIKAKDRRGIEQDEHGLGKGTNPYKNELKLYGFRKLLNGYFNLYRAALGFKPNNTANNRTLAKLAHDYYDKRQGGGEAYMEVGNLIYMSNKKLAHMMISVKPFGCMPSSASDGVQSRVSNDYPDVIFLSLETSGDSEVNFKSRAQMKIFEAKVKAKKEAEAVIQKLNIDIDKVKAFVDKHPKYSSGDFVVKGQNIGTGINFLVEMHKRMKSPKGIMKHQLSKVVKG
jgi:predicted nucleotide-binding protein (sugar kinase/HSP70/actin superfamily)